MNRQQAIFYNEQLSEQLKNQANSWGIDTELGKRIVDDFVMFLPESELKGIILLGSDSTSYKLGNVRLDLKNAIMAGLEFIASISQPEDIMNYIQLLIVAVIFIKNITGKELDGRESRLVYFLHVKNAYTNGVEEDTLAYEMKTWYQDEEIIEKDEMTKTIDRLCEMNVIEIDCGKLFLKEKVLGKMD